MPLQHNSRFGAVLLAAGTSSRMGHPKMLLPWGKTTILGHLLDLWQRLGATQIGVVHRATDQPIVAELNRLGKSPQACIDNPFPEGGMFSSVRCAAQWKGWREDLDSWIIVLGDQPQISEETLRRLLATVIAHPHQICQPAYQGRNCHPVSIPRDLFRLLPRSDAENLKAFLGMFKERRVVCEVQDASLTLDLDTPAEYEAAVRQFQP